jgi:YHS domain-containing protein
MKFSKIILITFATALAFNIAGCKKKEQPATPKAPAEVNKTADAAAGDTIEQTTCPVMGGAINKKVFVEYKGKKVYFCCASCKGDFEKDPEKYIAKLPQFQK